MTLKELSTAIDASEEVTSDIVDALEGIGFTDDQIIGLALALIRVKKSK